MSKRVASHRPSSAVAPCPPAAVAGPFLKWAGGKTQLLEQLRTLFPPAVERYYEPFLGSGAVFFLVERLFHPELVVLGDSNAELVNVFEQVQGNVEGVLDRLAAHKEHHGAEYYLDMRRRKLRSGVARAARFIYLNKTCYNGLWRVNQRGQFNVPMGRYANPPIHAPELLRRASQALRSARLVHGDYHEVVATARKGDFVYFDPPYVPLSATSSFTGYTQDDFGPEDQRRLAKLYRELDRRGCRVMLSNSDAPLVRELYRGYDQHEVLARRAINSKGHRRGAIKELVVLNYRAG